MVDTYCTQIILPELLEELSMQYNEHSFITLGDFNSKICHFQQLENAIFNNPNISVNCQVNKSGNLLVDIIESLGLLIIKGRTNGYMPAKNTSNSHQHGRIIISWKRYIFLNYFLHETLPSLVYVVFALRQSKLYNYQRSRLLERSRFYN